ncbi:phage portal protein [Enterococcus sp. CSURQ0835]|uniref:phage portal protein n=1 Tax=Enterococcus sp. CSURQ0835 TaxID=2681394 RepID=UPI001F213A63|nr:phage portal protein [Enterococcus sp. CSURQ0835]
MTLFEDFYGNFKPPEVMTFNKEKEITPQVVTTFIQLHQQELTRYQYLMRIYKGQMEIFDYSKKEAYKPDNRLAVNFAKFITDTFTGFFNGIPVKKSHPDKRINQKITDFDNLNDMEDEESELAKMACIYGRCYEFVYQNEDAETCVIYNSPEDLFIVYDDSIKQEPLFAVRYGIDESDNYQLKGQLYSLSGNKELSGSIASVRFGEDLQQFYTELPVTEWFLNEERMSVYESVVSLMNSFNKVISEKANDVDYFSDSYLKFVGAELDEEDLKTIRDNRIINYFGANADKLDVSFLDKPDSDSQTENLLDRLQKLIFQTSMVANISDESFGSSSGTALAYKLEAMSNLALAFQRKFQSSMNKRYKLFFSLGTNVPQSQAPEWKNIEYTFTRNVPRNVKEEAETATMLMGVTSEETALSTLSVVSDVKAEIDRIKEEKGAPPAFDFEQQPGNAATVVEEEVFRKPETEEA